MPTPTAQTAAPDGRTAPPNGQMYLHIPFEQKTRAKELGARWDGVAGAWYVPHGLDIHLFHEWWPDTMRAKWKALAKDLKPALKKGKGRKAKRNRMNGGAA